MSKHYLAPEQAHQAAVKFEEEPHPGVDDVLQRPDTYCPVSVKHSGPITTHELPSRFGTVGVVIASTTPVPVLSADKTRKQATLISTDSAFLVSMTRSIIGTNTAAIWPANVPLVIHHADMVVVATSTGTATISFITENWAE